MPERRPSIARGYPLFTILGFEVRLNLSWLVLGLLIAWTLAEGFFPQEYPDLARATRWWMGVAGAVGIFFSIVFHELSHSVVGRRFGLPIHGITLFIFGGMAEMRHEPRAPKAEFLMAGVGPLSSLVLALVFWQLQRMGEALGWPVPVIGVSHYLAIINVVLAVFNLVPAYPLDGGRMLRAGLWAWRGDLQSATRIASGIGRIFGLALMILGALSFIGGNVIGGVWYVLIGAFLRGAAGASYRQLLVRRFLEGKTVADLMEDAPPTVGPSATLRELVDEGVYRHRRRLFPVVEDSRLVGCVSVEDLRSVPEAEWGERTVGDVMSACSSDNTVAPDEPANELMSALLTQPAGGQRVVAQDGELVGTISLDDLRELMALRLELEKPGD